MHTLSRNHNTGGPCEYYLRRREIAPKVSQDSSQDNAVVNSCCFSLIVTARKSSYYHSCVA